MSLDVEGERILDAVVDGIADEFLAALRQDPSYVMSNIPSWAKFRNPFTGEPFVSEGTIMKCLQLVKEGIHRLPQHAKERIAIRALRQNTVMADSYASGMIRGKPQALTTSVLERSGLMVRYQPKALTDK